MTHIGHSEKVFNMKRLLLIFILTFSFQQWTKADDIRDFQIEGMAIGDSLLDHLSLNEISSKINSYKDKGYIYNSRDFYSLTFENNPKFQVYDSVQVQLKDNDNEYKIYSISGGIFYITNINNCYKRMSTIQKEFDILFSHTDMEQAPTLHRFNSDQVVNV